MTMFNDTQARSGRLSVGKVASDFVTDHFHLPWADRRLAKLELKSRKPSPVKRMRDA